MIRRKLIVPGLLAARRLYPKFWLVVRRQIEENLALHMHALFLCLSIRGLYSTALLKGQGIDVHVTVCTINVDFYSAHEGTDRMLEACASDRLRDMSSRGFPL